MNTLQFIPFNPSNIKGARSPNEPKLSKPVSAQACGTSDIQQNSLASRAAANIQCLPSKGATIAGGTKARDRAADIEPDIASHSIDKPTVLDKQDTVEHSRNNQNNSELLQMIALKWDPTC